MLLRFPSLALIITMSTFMSDDNDRADVLGRIHELVAHLVVQLQLGTDRVSNGRVHLMPLKLNETARRACTVHFPTKAVQGTRQFGKKLARYAFPQSVTVSLTEYVQRSICVYLSLCRVRCVSLCL